MRRSRFTEEYTISLIKQVEAEIPQDVCDGSNLSGHTSDLSR